MLNSLPILLITCLYANDTAQTPAIVTVNVRETVVYVGSNAVVEISVDVKEGYHIQAKEVNDESLIPTTLEVERNEYIQVEQGFPPSKQFKLEGTDNVLQVYDGKFLIKLFLFPVAKAQARKYVLSSKLKYQACDSKSCLFPRVIKFSIPLEIKPKK